MITIAILAILAAVALPNYFDSVRKSRRSEAVAKLAEIQQAQERWRANCSSFVTSAASIPVAPGASCTGGLGVNVTSSNYGYAVSAITGVASSVGYAATATAAGAQARDTRCAAMEMRMASGVLSYVSATSAGAIGAATADPNRCWNR